MIRPSRPNSCGTALLKTAFFGQMPNLIDTDGGLDKTKHI